MKMIQIMIIYMMNREIRERATSIWSVFASRFADHGPVITRDSMSESVDAIFTSIEDFIRAARSRQWWKIRAEVDEWYHRHVKQASHVCSNEKRSIDDVISKTHTLENNRRESMVPLLISFSVVRESYNTFGQDEASGGMTGCILLTRDLVE